MKKKLNIIVNMTIPTVAAYCIFFLLYNIFKQHFYEYRWLGVISFLIITGFVIKENKKEWKETKQQA